MIFTDNSRVIAFLMLLTMVLSSFAGVVFSSPTSASIETTEGKDLQIEEMKGGHFIENIGQWDEQFDLRAETTFGHIALGSSSILYNLIDNNDQRRSSGNVLRYEMVDSNDVHPVGSDHIPGVNNYILGDDASKWVSGARNFKGAVYSNVWNGIDLSYDLGDKGPKYEFILDPYTNPEKIKINVQGHDVIEVNDNSLIITLENGKQLKDTSLKAFYADDVKDEIEVSFIVIDESTFSFEIEQFDESRSIVIDPLIVYSTFVGGTGVDDNSESVMDDSGNIYVVGTSWSWDFPVTAGAYSDNYTVWGHAVIFKMDPSLSTLIYSTVVGGDATDVGCSIDLASNGEVIVAGTTTSSDFPTTNGSYQGEKFVENFSYSIYDLFVLRLNATGGDLIYSTYIGDLGSERLPKIRVDDSGNAVVLANVVTSNFTTTPGAYDRSFNEGDSDMVLFVLNENGSALRFSTFIGGSGFDEPADMILLDDELVYATGRTNSTNFPTTSGAFDTSYNVNITNENPFVLCFNLTSNDLEFSTFMSIGQGSAITLDAQRNIYVGGSTHSWRYLSTPGAFRTNRTRGAREGFVFKMDPAGSRLIYSTFIGGGYQEYISDIAVNSSGCAYLVGRTYSYDFPTTPGSYLSNNSNNIGSFVSTFLPDGSDLIYSTFLGGSSRDYIDTVHVCDEKFAYVSGYTQSGSYPVSTGAYSSTIKGVDDFIITKLKCSKILLPPTHPIELTGRMEGNQVILEWEIPQFDGFTPIIGYNISRGLAEYGETKVGTSENHSYLDEDIEVTETYYYFVTSYNKVGTSPISSRIKVEETVPPMIHQDLTTSEIIPGMQLNFKTWITDNAELEDVRLIYWIDDGTVDNVSMYNYGKDDNWTYYLELPDREFDLSYYFYAIDSKLNQVVSELKVVPVTGEFLPTFLQDNTPSLVGSLKDLEFSVNITDNWDVDDVYVEYWIHDGFHRNRTLDAVSENEFGFSTIAAGIPGDLINYIFSAKDNDGNWNSTRSKEISIVDDELPYLIEDHTPDQGTTGEKITFKAEAMDDMGWTTVTLRYHFGEGEEETMIMSNPFGVMFESSIEIQHSLDALHYSYHLTDKFGNSDSSEEKTIKIVDNDPPILISDTSDEMAANDGLFSFRIAVEDNIGIGDVSIERWFNNGNRDNQILTGDGLLFVGQFMVPPNILGEMNYVVHVKDSSGNHITGSPVKIEIMDNTPPSIGQVEDVTTYINSEIEIELTINDNIDITAVTWSGLPTAWTRSRWAGSFEEKGEYEIMVRVEDAGGQKAAMEFSILVLGKDHDTDGDGLPDLFEMEIGLSYTDPNDASMDLDGDGLTNSYEFILGTHLDQRDTDNDGMTDGWEDNYGLEPLVPSAENDEDNDELEDLVEFIKGTDPTVPNIVETGDDRSSFGKIHLVLSILMIVGVLIIFFLLIKKRD